MVSIAASIRGRLFGSSILRRYRAEAVLVLEMMLMVRGSREAIKIGQSRVKQHRVTKD